MHTFIMSFQSSLFILVSIYLLSGCTPSVVEFPTEVQTIYDQNTEYRKVKDNSQISENNVKELRKQYPKDFYRSDIPVIPTNQKKKVGVTLFISNPNQPGLAKLVTDVFTTIFVNSRQFIVVEREQLNQIISEIELNQSGLLANNGLEAQSGGLSGVDFLVTGTITQTNGTIIYAKVMDVTTGYIDISEKITTQNADRRSAELLAGIVLSAMTEKYYNTSNN